MTFVKINDVMYPTISVNGYMVDHSWNGRASKYITLEMSAEEARSLFVNDMTWFLVAEDHEHKVIEDPETGMLSSEVETVYIDYDNSEYSVAGDIVDHRNGTVTVKMGTMTREELLNMLMEGLNL